VGRALNVVKMRKSWHAMTLNSYTITDQGVTVGDNLEGVTGRLGWSALRAQGPPDRTESTGGRLRAGEGSEDA
jgi:hypothetical protein